MDRKDVLFGLLDAIRKAGIDEAKKPAAAALPAVVPEGNFVEKARQMGELMETLQRKAVILGLINARLLMEFPKLTHGGVTVLPLIERQHEFDPDYREVYDWILQQYRDAKWVIEPAGRDPDGDLQFAFRLPRPYEVEIYVTTPTEDEREPGDPQPGRAALSSGLQVSDSGPGDLRARDERGTDDGRADGGVVPGV